MAPPKKQHVTPHIPPNYHLEPPKDHWNSLQQWISAATISGPTNSTAYQHKCCTLGPQPATWTYLPKNKADSQTPQTIKCKTEGT